MKTADVILAGQRTIENQLRALEHAGTDNYSARILRILEYLEWCERTNHPPIRRDSLTRLIEVYQQRVLR